MNRKTLIAGCILSAFLLATLPATAGGNANVLFGKKSVSDSTLEGAQVDGPLESGLAYSLDYEWPVMLAFDLLRSVDDETTTVTAGTPIHFRTVVTTTEFDFGVRKYWGDRVQPYVGTGVAFIFLDVNQRMSGTLGGGSPFDTLVVDDSDSAFGYWVNAGLQFRVSGRFILGIDVRHSDADVAVLPEADTETADLSAGGTHYAVAFGVHW